MNIRISFQWTPDDLQEFQKAHRKFGPQMLPQSTGKSRRKSFLLWLLVVFGFMLFFVLVRDDSPPPASPLPGTVPVSHSSQRVYFLLNVVPWLIIALVIWFFFLRNSWGKRPIRRAFEQNPRLGDPHDLEIAGDHITLRDPHCTSIMEWPHFIRFFETSTLFLLYTSPHAAHLVPKRAFTSPEEMDTFRALAQARIDNRPSGFPVLPVGASMPSHVPSASGS